MGGRRGRGRDIGGIRVCVRDLKSRGWERREGERGRESRQWERESKRESKGWERGEKVCKGWEMGEGVGRGWERE